MYFYTEFFINKEKKEVELKGGLKELAKFQAALTNPPLLIIIIHYLIFNDVRVICKIIENYFNNN